MAEIRVCAININDEALENVDIPKMSKEEFYEEAERQGLIYSLEGFLRALNYDRLNNVDFLYKSVEIENGKII